MQLYISRGEEISGPFSYEQVQDYLTAGVLFSEDLACWHDGTGGWMPLGELMAQTPGHTTPPPALTQPEPAITTTPANSSTKKKLLIGISAAVTVLAIAVGAGIWFWLGLEKDKSPANKPNPGAEIKANSDQEPEGVAAKLTAAEASEILGEDIGRWEMTGKHMPNPEEEDAPDAEPFESTFEVRWKVEGKSLVCIWAMVINGNKVQFVGYKDFDAKKGVFTWRTKGDGFPEMITRERYDRQTKTLFWEFTYPDGTKEASTFQIVNKDKRLQKTQATRNGKVVFRNEATFTRMAKPEPSNPIIAKLTPAEAAEVMAWEIGKWETKGQAKQLGEKEGGGLIETKFETESSMECAWKEEGRSLEFKFSMTQGGETIIFFGRKHYDAAKGVFIYRQWGERMPESISHERYDLATRTFYAETAPVIPPAKTRSTAVTKRIGNNKTQQRLEVREGDQLVYAHDIVSTRINTAPTEVDPKLIAEGKKLFQAKICFTCHQTDPKVPAPAGLALGASNFIGEFWGREREVHEGLGGPIKTVIFDEAYFTQQIRRPMDWVLKGALAPMPPTVPINDEELKALIAYVKSLSKSAPIQTTEPEPPKTAGTVLWEFETGGFVSPSPAIGSDGTVYVGSNDKKLYAINGKTGVKLWEFETGGEVYSSPAIGSDGTVYVGSWDNKLYALNGKSGVKLWEFETGSGVYSSPAIGSDGTVYVGSNDKKLYAINGKTGGKLWEFVTGRGVSSSPAIGFDGTVYVGSWDKKLYAINGKTGVKLWEFETGDGVSSSPAIGSDGTVYVGSYDKKLYAINGKSGVKLWEFETGDGVYSSPAIGSDGTVYVGSYDFKLYAIKTDSKGLAKSPWPMRGQNLQHTGRAADAADPPVVNPEPTAPNLGKMESPEALAKRTLDALSKNDFQALSKLGAESLPKEVLIDTMVNLRYAVTEENIKHTAQRRNITEEEAKEYLKEKIQKEKARMEGGYQEGMKQISAKRKLSFDRVITEGKKQANIEWGKVSFVRLEGEPFEKNGIKGGDFFIVLAYQGNNFKIKLDDCMHYPKHGWFLTHGPDWGDGTDDAGPPDETSEGESSHEEPARPEPAPNAPAKGLVAYYPFNGNTRNEAGNDHHGQVFGAKLTADRHGRANSAYQFKPGDHIKIDGLMGKPKNLTLSAWVKLDGQQGRLGSEIISLGDIAVLRADNKSPYSQRAGTGGVFFGGEKFWVHTMAKANYTGTGWHQIIFTFDDEANAQVTYVDGKQMVSKKNPKSIVYEGGGTDTFIGIHGKTAKLNWRSQGIIDDLRVYDRALTAAEVKALFRSEKPAFPLQAGNPIKITTIAELRAKAQAGDAQSQVSLGLKFINGADGLKKNPQATEKLWLRAAKQGELTAQMNLGLLYSRGALGEKDPLKAYQWAKLSFQGGHQRAKQLAETLEKELTPEQIAEAEQFIKTFKPVVEQHGDIPAPVEPSKPTKKLTPEEINEALSLRVGTFKVTEKESEKVLETFTGTWVKKGLSTEFRNTGENKGFAIVTYDPVQNLFIENFENGASIHHSTWNPLTKTLVRRLITPKPPAGESVTMFLRKIGPNQNDIRVEFRRNGELVRKIEAIGTRIEKPAELAPSTKPESSDDDKKPGTVLWEFETGGEVYSSPAIGSDGTVYVGSKDSKVYALDGKTGVKLWEFKTGDYVTSSPAIGSDGTIYVGSHDKNLYAIHGKSGEKIWEFETGHNVQSSPAIGSDGTVYIGSWDTKLYALSGKTGVKLWEFKTGSIVRSSPAIGSGGTLYIGSNDNKLYAINSKNGVKLWDFKTEFDLQASPSIGADGTIYAGSDDNNIFSLIGGSGAKKWEFRLGPKFKTAEIRSSPAIGVDGTVYIGSNDSKVYALDGKTGAKKWEFETGSHVDSSPAIGSDGTVYVGSYDKKLYAINGKSGVKLWEFVTGDVIESSSPAIGPDGTVYVGSTDNKLYAIKTDSKGLAKSPWPMRGQNAQHTGRAPKKE